MSFPSSRRILLTGASGQVGRELLVTLASLGEVVALDRAEIDLTDAASVRAVVQAVRPRWIVNAAAYTAVDKAESEPDLAAAVNVEAVTVLGQEALALGAAMVHFSTDYVFNGQKAGPYAEKDATGPVSVYGKTKLDGELALQASGASHIIFRTSWVYGVEGKNFLRTILRLARERQVVRVVADQHGSPTWSRDLARLTAHAIGVCEDRARDGDLRTGLAEFGGVYHAAGSGYTTWFAFAREAVEAARRHKPEVQWASVEPISTAEYPTAARRPANSCLDCGRLQERLGWIMPHWRESLLNVTAELE